MLIGDIPRRNAYRYPDAVAFETEDETLTWRDLDARVDRVARGLHEAGLRSGDRLAVFAPASLAVVATYFAAAKLGAVIVPLHTGLVEHEVAFMLDDVAARVVVVGEEVARRARATLDAAGSLVARVVIGANERDIPFASLLDGPPAGDPADTVDEDAPFAIRYTSGTTGLPKGVPSSHRDWLTRSRNFLIHVGHSHDDRVILASPLSLGLGSSLLTTYSYVGARIALRARFDPDDVLRTVAARRTTTFMFPLPMMYQNLLESPSFAQTDLSSLRIVGYGGAVFPVPLLVQMIERLPCAIFGVYGSLEGGGFDSYLFPEDHRLAGCDEAERERKLTRLRSCGREAHHAEIRVVDAAGHQLPPGEIGELVLRSEGALKAYWNRPGEIEKTLRDGWIHSGDGAWIDQDRYIYMSDRLKDVVRSGGMNVSALDVETALLEHPAVAETAVFGVAHPYWTEALIAAVVQRPHTEADEATLIAHCKTTLANYKVPKRIVFLEELPKNTMGKVVKRELRERYAELSAGIPAAEARV